MDINTPTQELLDTVRLDIARDNTGAALIHLTLLVEKLALYNDINE